MAVSDRGRPRWGPAWATDLPLLLALLACGLLVAVPWAHIALGLAMAGLAVLHLRTRTRLGRRMLRWPRSVRRLGEQTSAWLIVAAACAATATGLLRWAGLPPEDTWHGGSGLLLLGAAGVHVGLVRRRLRLRIRSPRTRRRVSRRRMPGAAGALPPDGRGRAPLMADTAEQQVRVDGRRPWVPRHD
jgi:hypothetical protein